MTNYKKALLKIWERKDGYHHLNSNVNSDRDALEKLAKEKACLLVEVESEIFKISFGNDGSIIPKYPKYWKIRGNQAKVFLKLEP